MLQRYARRRRDLDRKIAREDHVRHEKIAAQTTRADRMRESELASIERHRAVFRDGNTRRRVRQAEAIDRANRALCSRIVHIAPTVPTQHDCGKPQAKDAVPPADADEELEPVDPDASVLVIGTPEPDGDAGTPARRHVPRSPPPPPSGARPETRPHSGLPAMRPALPPGSQRPHVSKWRRRHHNDAASSARPVSGRSRPGTAPKPPWADPAVEDVSRTRRAADQRAGVSQWRVRSHGTTRNASPCRELAAGSPAPASSSGPALDGSAYCVDDETEEPSQARQSPSNRSNPTPPPYRASPALDRSSSPFTVEERVRMMADRSDKLNAASSRPVIYSERWSSEVGLRRSRGIYHTSAVRGHSVLVLSAAQRERLRHNTFVFSGGEYSSQPRERDSDPA